MQSGNREKISKGANSLLNFIKKTSAGLIAEVLLYNLFLGGTSCFRKKLIWRFTALGFIGPDNYREIFF